jgi:hypothetical protein
MTHSRAVGHEPLQAAPLDHDEQTVTVDGDAVAVDEMVGDDAHGAVGRVREHAAVLGLGRGIVAGVGEVHDAVGRDAEIVRRVEAVIEQVRDLAVARREL